MNYIALTGSDMRAMALAAEILLERICDAGVPAAEILLERICDAGVPAAIFLYVNDARQAAGLRERLQPGEVGELWRVGHDTHHRELDQLVDVHLAQPDGRCVSAALRGFARRLQSLPAITSPALPRSETTV